MATKEEWIAIIEQEEGELFILNIIEDIIHESEEILFKKHIDIQILPFTVNYAHQTIMDLINCHFFTRDPGNVDNCLWIPDKGPWN